MPTLLEARETYRGLSTKAHEVATDPDLAVSEKRSRLEQMGPDLKAAAKTVEDLQYVEDAVKGFFADSNTNPAGEQPDVKDASGAAKTPGEQFVSSQTYKQNIAGGSLIGKGLGWGSGEVELKTTLTSASGSGSGAIFPQYLPSIVPINFRRLTVEDLLPSGVTSSNTIIYPVETTATNAAAATAENAAKPESTLVLGQNTEPVKKVATFLPVSEEMLMDYDQTRSYIDGRLGLFVMLATEDELLNGSGSGAHLTGLLNRSGLQTAQALGGDVRPDAIYKQITAIRAAAFVEPDAVVVHPTDWQSIRLLKDANGQYYAGGPFTGAYGNGASGAGGGLSGGYDSIWGLRVVVTPAIAQGTALVGAFAQGAQVFNRMGLTIEASNSHSTFFQYNLVAIRAERRLGLAVFRPGAFGTVTGL